MDVAKLVASWSKDPSSKIGAIIVKDMEIKSTGYNGFPKGIEDLQERLNNRAVKYKLMVHAERNALIQAGKDSREASLFIYGLPPCSECTKQIIQAGIKEVIVCNQDVPERWKEEFIISTGMLNEAGVDLRTIKYE